MSSSNLINHYRTWKWELERAIKVLREEGIRTFFFKLLDGIGCYRRAILRERLLNNPIPEIKPQVQVTIALLKKTEADEYIAFLSKDNPTRIDNNPSHIVDRLNGNNWCFVARHAGEMISTCWATIHRARFPHLFCEIKLAQDEVYVYDAFTRPDFRGKSVLPAMIAKAILYFRAARYQRIVSAVVPESKSMLQSGEKVGFETFGIIRCIKIGPWRRNFYRTKRVTIQSHRKLQPCTKLAWQAYEYLPVRAEDFIKRCFRYILPFKNLRMPVVILRGQTRYGGNQAAVLVAGAEQEVDYLISRFFEGAPQRESKGKVALWNLAGTLKHLRASADLTIARVDRFSSRLFFGRDYLAVPEWVGTILTVPNDLAKLARGNSSLKSDLRIVERNKLIPEFTKSYQDFEKFYHGMYVPFTHKRYGQQAVIRNFYWMRRSFRRGGLVWVTQNGQRISGVLYRRQGKTLQSLAMGTANGEWAFIKAGANVATDLFIVKHAKELCCNFVDFGGSRPSLNDGVLRYKRKWGMNLIDKHDTYYDFLVHWNRCSSSVIAFLSNTPLIFQDNGGLSAIKVIDCDKPATNDEAWKTYHSNWIEGLHRLYIIATSGWETGQNSPPQTTLLGPTNVGGWQTNTPPG
jgi:GNAT superfamily N-acetyltransferase